MEHPCSWKSESPNHFHVHPHHYINYYCIFHMDVFRGGLAFLVLPEKACIIINLASDRAMVIRIRLSYVKLCLAEAIKGSEIRILPEASY